MNDKEQIRERIQAFFDGSDPMERIIKIECGYNDDKVTVIYRREDDKKRVKKEPFRPFVWAKQSACRELFSGDKKVIRQKLETWGIECKGLRINRDDGTVPERMKNGYRVLFQAKQSMTYSKFMDFFKEGGMPIYPNQRDRNYGRKDYMAVSPVEQFMIYTGKRQFKGYDDYDDLVRMQWDLETEGLDPEKDAISQIGIRTNKGFEKVIKVEGIGEEKRINEIKAIREFFQIIHDIQPDVISGHNTENFDWNFIDVRLKPIGGLESISKDYLPRGVYKKKKQQVLKLGGEMEYYYPTVMWGYDLTDSLFAVRRAQAIDSNIKSANLKYITKYSGLNKKNRVYVPGKLINSTWEDKTLSYIFNDENGNWMKYDSTKTYTDDNGQEINRYSENNDGTIIDNKTGENFELTSGRYIVERYLLDDLYETDKVELQYNQSNYLVSKMLPVPFEKVCTMGTAAIWKYIMMAWSYENNLAIPEIIAKRPFVGGLSRLIKVGYVDRIIKLDFNSLYPSIELTYGIRNEVDVMDVLLAMLEHVLTKREYFKEQKAIHGSNADKLKEQIKTVKDILEKEELEGKLSSEKKKKNAANTLQLPLKILGNSYFGGSSSGTPFPWTDTNCIGPEQTTCTGRQMLRLMIYHFSNLSTFNGQNLGEDFNYTPIVGDSFTGDTPLFIKYNDSGLIDIKPIASLIDEQNIEVDGIGREYDYSPKNYKVLCRSGWVSPSYIYRHVTDKPIYMVSDGDMIVEVTEDHSLFDSDHNKIKPNEINEDTRLEYNKIDIFSDFNNIENSSEFNDTWLFLLNATIAIKKQFIDSVDIGRFKNDKVSMAKVLFIRNCVNKVGL
jgi:uncharacterized protein YprB with RNaseH-like and TPR domain